MKDEIEAARNSLMLLRKRIVSQLTPEEIQTMEEQDRPVTLPPTPEGSVRAHIWATEAYPAMFAEEWSEENDPRYEFWADLPADLWEEYESAVGSLATVQGRVARWLRDNVPADDRRFEWGSMDRWIEESVDLG